MGERETFWAFHDLLYAKAPAKPERLKAYPGEVRLGLPASGAQLLESFVRAIEDELARARRGGSWLAYV